MSRWPFPDYLNRIRRSLRKLFRQPGGRKKPPVPLVVDYYEHLLVPPLAVFVGVVMVVYGHHIPFGHFIRSVDFYKAVLPSIASAWVVMRLIVRDTRLLDGNCPWWRGWWPGPFRRTLMQLCLGVIKPAFFSLGIFSIYFLVRSRPDLIPRYIIEDLPLIILLLAGFNLLCWAYHQARMNELSSQWTIWMRRIRKNLPNQDDDTALLSGVEVIPYSERVRDSIALYEPDGQHDATLCIGFDGKKDMEPRPMKEVYSEVAGLHFFQVRRELIVNRDAIIEVQREGDDVDVVLSKPRPGIQVRVSKRRKKDFLAWWEDGQHEARK